MRGPDSKMTERQAVQAKRFTASKKRPQIVPLSWCLRVAAPRPQRCNSPNERSVCQRTPELSRTVLGFSWQLSSQDYFQRWQKVGVKTQTTNFLLLNAHYFLALSRREAALRSQNIRIWPISWAFSSLSPGRKFCPCPPRVPSAAPPQC